MALPIWVVFSNRRTLAPPSTVMFAVPVVASWQKHMKPPLVTVKVPLPALLLSSNWRRLLAPSTLMCALPAVALLSKFSVPSVTLMVWVLDELLVMPLAFRSTVAPVPIVNV